MEKCVLPSPGATARMREKNRQENPEAAEVVDELRRLGFDPKVKYIGPLREQTVRALKLEGRAPLTGS